MAMGFIIKDSDGYLIKAVADPYILIQLNMLSLLLHGWECILQFMI